MCARWLRPSPWSIHERRKEELYIPAYPRLTVYGSPAQVEVNWKTRRQRKFCTYNPSGGRPKGVRGFLIGIVNR